ncbi:hypothetical protein J2S16_002322 [Cytobacillus kochii]|nr:hypothetical protein [Cytobacillus kochii]
MEGCLIVGQSDLIEVDGVGEIQERSKEVCAS